MHRLFLPLILALAACTHLPSVPARGALSDAFGTTPPSEARTLAAVEAPEQLPLPVSAGLLLGAGVELSHGVPARVVPVQVAVGSVALARPGERVLALELLGGVSGPFEGQVRAAWGLGLGYELTRGQPYEVRASAGVLWLAGQEAPLVVLGAALSPKF